MPLSKVKIRWGYLIALLLMLISYTLIFYIIRRLAHETTLVNQSYEIINTLQSIKGELTDAETGVRGYVITGEPRFLNPYTTGSQNVMPLFNSLKKKTFQLKGKRKRIDSLGRLLDNRLKALATSIADYQRGGYKITEEMVSRRETNKVTMDSIRVLITELQEEERTTMREKDERLKSFFTGTQVITITSLIVALVTIIYSVLIYHRENRAKEKAILEATSYSQQLEERVEELARVNNELQELKSIEKFAATGRIARTMAHEVRNPLTNISLASEQLKEIITNDEEGGVLLEMIGRNVSRINQLVSDLLHSTRFAQLEYAYADINLVMDDTLELANDRIELNGIEVQKSYANDLANVYVDREKIKLAFLNIIVNAIEAMEKTGGTLQIRTRRAGNRCLVEIKDDGVGMDEETIQKLFEPYFTGKLKGNGLGLTNTQNIILNHRGTISVKSRVGAGTTFTIALNFKAEDMEEKN